MSEKARVKQDTSVDEKLALMKTEVTDRQNQIFALEIEVQRLQNSSILDKQLIEEQQRQIDQDERIIAKMRQQESLLTIQYKNRYVEEMNHLRKAFEKIGKVLKCIGCQKISSDCMLLNCGHTICSDCQIKQQQLSQITCEEC